MMGKKLLMAVARELNVSIDKQVDIQRAHRLATKNQLQMRNHAQNRRDGLVDRAFAL